MSTMASQSQAPRLFAQPFVQAQIKENTTAPRHRPLRGESTVTGGFPSQRASNMENVSIWWRHNGNLCMEFKLLWSHIFDDLDTVSSYKGHEYVIISYNILWDCVTYPCPWYLFWRQSRHWLFTETKCDISTIIRYRKSPIFVFTKPYMLTGQYSVLHHKYNTFFTNR